jgi:hypothetical protein
MPRCGETNKGHLTRTASQELTLSSALSDPLILTLMAADNVDPAKIDAAADRGRGCAKLVAVDEDRLRLQGLNLIVCPDIERSAPSSPSRSSPPW